MENDFEQREDLNHEEPQGELVSEGEPNPADFEDYDLYVQALVDHQVKKTSAKFTLPSGPMQAYEVKRAVAAGVQEALTPPPQPETLTPFSDDAHRAERSELTRLSMEYGKQAIMARESGKADQARTWRDRQAQIEKDISKLPPPPEQVWAEERAAEIDDISVKQLFDPDLKDHPAWDHERMLNDAPLVVARSNKAAKTILRLPGEESPWGNIEPCKPANMMQIELTPEQMKEFKTQVYGKGDADPDTIFRRSWRTLHKMGYASQAQRAFAEKESTEGKSLEKMSQKEFNAEMERREAERLGGPRKGFVMPRPIHR